MQNSQKSLK